MHIYILKKLLCTSIKTGTLVRIYHHTIVLIKHVLDLNLTCDAMMVNMSIRWDQHMVAKQCVVCWLQKG